MDEAGFATAHIVGNSLGGYLALHLAARGRAESVVALAPAGGWAKEDESYKETLDFFPRLKEQVQATAPHVDALLGSTQGRRMRDALHDHELRAHPGRAARPPDPRGRGLRGHASRWSSTRCARATTSMRRRSPAR